MLKNFCLGRKVKKLAKLRPGWNGMFELFLFFLWRKAWEKIKKRVVTAGNGAQII